MSGLTIGTPEDRLGICASSTCTVTMDNVHVDQSQILGKVGKGYKYVIETLNEGRIEIAAQMLGIAQGTFDATLPYLRERQCLEKVSFQGMELQYAKAASEIEATRLLVYNASRKKENGQEFLKEADMAKWYVSVVAAEKSRQCIEWMGGI
eukprot:snap_masked-scaffold_28-processed-gene-4.55-mRNA-1 protein AED:0.29 eAED:0.29 QI:0/0/0/1/1/1/2/0/150